MGKADDITYRGLQVYSLSSERASEVFTQMLQLLKLPRLTCSFDPVMIASATVPGLNKRNFKKNGSVHLKFDAC